MQLKLNEKAYHFYLEKRDEYVLKPYDDIVDSKVANSYCLLA